MEKKDLVYKEALKKATQKIEQLYAEVQALHKVDPIAIIGTALRFPGGANSPELFWNLLEEGVDASGEVPTHRWDVEQYYHPDQDKPGKTYTKRGSFLEININSFDNEFFEISPVEAKSMDPQQRLLMEVSWEAFESAGLNIHTLRGSCTGVFISIGSEYPILLSEYPNESYNSFITTGTTSNAACGRISYFYDLQGPSISIDTGCSSSLVALHLAVESLNNKRCNLALAGGIQLHLTPISFISLSRSKALAPDGRCKTFSNDADGYGKGEGCGLVVLKRFSEAVEDGDKISGIITGTDVLHNGRSNGLTAPNGIVQEKVIRRAQKKAGVLPEQISYIETHGTGTPLGDPIEISTLETIFKQRKDKVPIGAVKTNIGHLEAAAGIAGVLKVIYSLEHEILPPSLHSEKLNSRIEWDKIPIKVLREKISWKRGKDIRIAGISSFGISGTNSHLILQEAPLVPTPPKTVERDYHILPLSAKNKSALVELFSRYYTFLNKTGESITDICFTAGLSRSSLDIKYAIIGQTKEEFCKKLKLAINDNQEIFDDPEHYSAKKVVFLFTGQDSQYPGMAKELYASSPVFREALDRCSQLFFSYIKESVIQALFEEDKNDCINEKSDENITKLRLLNKASIAQAAIFSIEYSLSKLWESWGVKPDVVIGHSIGEFAAACTAGVFTLEEAVKMVAARGTLMDQVTEAGKMVGVLGGEKKVLPLIEPYKNDISIAVVNTQENITLSGKAEAIDAVVKLLKKERIFIEPLNISHAFHSIVMAPYVPELEFKMKDITFSKPQIPIISTVTGNFIKEKICTPSYWSNHIRNTVRFLDAIKVAESQGNIVFLEIGGTAVLSGLASQVVSGDDALFTPSLRNGTNAWKQILSSLAALYNKGIPIDWVAFDSPYVRKKVTLPHYTFQRKILQLPPLQKMEDPLFRNQKIIHPLLGYKQDSPSKEIRFLNYIDDRISFINDHNIFDHVFYPLTAYLEMAYAAGSIVCNKRNVLIKDVVMIEELSIKKNNTILCQSIVKPIHIDSYSMEIYARLDDTDEWKLLSTMTIEKQETISHQPELISFESLNVDSFKTHTQDEFYSILQERGYNYQDTFKQLHRVWSNAKEYWGEINTEQVPVLENFQFHPALLYSCLQMLLFDFAQTLGEDEIILPDSIDNCFFYKKPGAKLKGHYIRNNNVDQNYRSDLSIYNENGELCVRLEGIQFKKTTKSIINSIIQKDENNMFYHIAWDSKPLTEEIHKREKNDCWLILKDQTDIGETLAARLRDKNQKVFIITPGQAFNKSEVNYSINPDSPEDFERVIEDLHEQGIKKIHGIIHLWNLGKTNYSDHAAIETSHKQGVMSAIHLIKTISKLNLSPEMFFITNGVYSVLPTDKDISMFQSPIWGIMNAVSFELSEYHTFLIDLSLSPGNDELDILFKHIWSYDNEKRICIRQKERFVQRIKQVDPCQMEDNLPSSSKIGPDKTYILVGGFGSLGGIYAQWLFENGARHIVMAGRSQPKPETRIIIDTLKEKGMDVRIMKMDVSLSEEVNQFFHEVIRTMPPIKGIFHLSGVLNNQTVLNSTWEDVREVFEPKIGGSVNLHNISINLELDLDMFVLFSSIVSFTEYAGIASYSAANNFLNALTRLRRVMGLPGISLNWGPWAEVGMSVANSVFENMFKTYGLTSIQPSQGGKLMEIALKKNMEEPCIMDIDWMIYLSEIARGTMFYETIAREKGFEDDEDNHLQKALEEAYPIERVGILVPELQKIAANVLGYDNYPDLPLNKSLRELGADSLIALNIRKRIARIISVRSLPATLLFSYPTINAIAHYLLQDVLSLEIENIESKNDNRDSSNDFLGEIESILGLGETK